jgi:hypothetical protein
MNGSPRRLSITAIAFVIYEFVVVRQKLLAKDSLNVESTKYVGAHCLTG